MNVQEPALNPTIYPIIFLMIRDSMADNLGLRARTEKEMEDFKTGYYMDLNGNLAVVNSVIRKENEDAIEFSGDIDAMDDESESESEIANQINKQSVHYWEYLGPL